MSLLYRLTGPPPCKQYDVIQIAKRWFRVLQIETFYYAFPSSGTLNSQVYSVDDLKPSPDVLHYITGFGTENFGLTFQLQFTQGNPRGSPGGRSVQRLDFVLAPYDIPFQMKTGVMAGDTIAVDVTVPAPNFPGKIWFYGYKIRIRELFDQPAENVILLEDIRSIEQ